MASQFVFANNAASTLASPINATATSLTVQSGAGAEFPNPGAGQQFAATLNDAATGLLTEIVYCTAVTGDTFTAVARGQEGTTALNWIAGDLVANLLTAGQMAAMVQQVSVSPSRIVTASGTFATTTADAGGKIGLNRTSGVSASQTTLPSNAQPSQTYTYQDLARNFRNANMTVIAPAGMSIAQASEIVMNVNGQSCTFTYYGSNIWGASGVAT